MGRLAAVAHDGEPVDYALTVFVVAMIGFAAFGNNFIQDDGFISLRYADHWARGYGPVWYPGSTEFGYTNFLFVALCAALMAAGVGPVLAANVVSYSGFALAVMATHAIIMRLTRDAKIAAICILVIFTNFTVSSYASGLLETSLQAGLVLLTYWGVIRYAREPNRWLPFAIAIAASLAMLTRLDSSLLLLPAGVYALWRLRSRRDLTVFLTAPTLLVGGFLLFCHLQYGQILPNTFYAKTGGPAIVNGIAYTMIFMDVENFSIAILFAAVFMLVHQRYSGKWRPQENLPEILLLSAPAVLWGIYVLYIGGGFMGFRLMIPIIVFLVVLGFVLAAPFKPYWLLACFAAFAILTSQTHKWISSTLFDHNRFAVQSTELLNGHVVGNRMNWRLTGRRLHALFYSGSPDDVSIATTAAGAIPFYAGLPTIDLFGLNDRWIARNGNMLLTNRPGHRRIAPLKYLKEKKVNLIIGHPTYVCDDDSVKSYAGSWVELSNTLPVILVPIASGCSLITYYNHMHPRLERMLREGALVLASGK